MEVDLKMGLGTFIFGIFAAISGIGCAAEDYKSMGILYELRNGIKYYYDRKGRTRLPGGKQICIKSNGKYVKVYDMNDNVICDTEVDELKQKWAYNKEQREKNKGKRYCWQYVFGSNKPEIIDSKEGEIVTDVFAQVYFSGVFMGGEITTKKHDCSSCIYGYPDDMWGYAYNCKVCYKKDRGYKLSLGSRTKDKIDEKDFEELKEFLKKTGEVRIPEKDIKIHKKLIECTREEIEFYERHARSWGETGGHNIFDDSKNECIKELEDLEKKNAFYDSGGYIMYRYSYLSN